MAKRRRLTPSPDPAAAGTAPETKAFPTYPLGLARTTTRAPIAQVAGDSAERAALADLVREIEAARGEGRLAIRLPLAAVAVDHLVRDRIALEPDDMTALEASLAERGQQTPIEVVETGEGRYGLLSGWRRVEALRRIGAEAVLAFVRRPETVAAAWRAMVEENEIRSPLSFYERARIAAEAAEAGLFPDAGAAVAALFASAPGARRSKIAAFVPVHRALGGHLRFPAAIPEKLGLALARGLETPGFAERLRDTLRKAAPETPEAERALLERALHRAGSAPPATSEEVAPGIALRAARGRLTLSGPGVDAALRRDLAFWLAARRV